MIYLFLYFIVLLDPVFNPRTSIIFSTSSSEEVTMKLYDALGIDVETLIEKEIFSGKRKIIWHGSAYSSGIFFVKLTTLNSLQVKKIMLVK